MSVSGQAVVVYRPGQIISMAVSAAVTAGTLVEISGNKTVGPAGASSRKVLGLAMQTASASGDIIPVQVFGYVVRIANSGGVTAGDELAAAAAGAVATMAAAGGATAGDINNARAVIGVALETASNGVAGLVLIGKS